MDDKKKEILSMVLLLTVTAAVFFLLGTWADTLFGTPKRPATEIEYIPQSTSSTTVAKPSSTASSVLHGDSTTGAVQPTTSTVSTEMADTSTTTTVVYPINLNTATKEELMTIKGIGEAYAQRILDYRDEINGFDYLEQLMEIEGIGEGRFKAWSPYLTIA